MSTGSAAAGTAAVWPAVSPDGQSFACMQQVKSGEQGDKAYTDTLHNARNSV